MDEGKISHKPLGGGGEQRGSLIVISGVFERSRESCYMASNSELLRCHLQKYQANDGTAVMRLAAAWLQQFGSLLLFVYGWLPWFIFVPVYALAMLNLFMIFHDAGHSSFFTSKTANRSLEWLLSFSLLTPIDWTLKHAVHHRQSGNLAKDPTEWSDTIYFTVDQYYALPLPVRFAYRIFRDPLFFYTLVPFLNWIVKYRIPFVEMLDPAQKQIPGNNPFLNSVLNTFIGYLYFAWVNWMWGWDVLKFVCMGSYMTGMIGVFLFHLQHAFNPAYVAREGWNLKDSALKGSSLLTIPWFLKWNLMGIEYHHIHHYSTLVPGYNLQRCHEEASPDLFESIPLLDYQTMFDSLSLALYDEQTDKYVTFSEATDLHQKRTNN